MSTSRPRQSASPRANGNKVGGRSASTSRTGALLALTRSPRGLLHAAETPVPDCAAAFNRRNYSGSCSDVRKLHYSSLICTEPACRSGIKGPVATCRAPESSLWAFLLGPRSIWYRYVLRIMGRIWYTFTNRGSVCDECLLCDGLIGGLFKESGGFSGAIPT